MQQLATLNVSVDADITVALGTPETFIIYDVWSSGYVQGGELVTDFIGEWSQNQTLLMQPFKSKYYHRINFKQILMKASFAVSRKLDCRIRSAVRLLYCGNKFDQIVSS